MVRLYGWASVITPILGMVMSMISHRYAYMYAGEALALVFVFTCIAHLKNDRVNGK